MVTIRRRFPDAPGCADWNAAVARARADYETRPNRACAYEGCSNLADGVRQLCMYHLTLGIRRPL